MPTILKRCLLVRHGQTQGNLERRYMGRRSNEPLSPEGVAALINLRQEYFEVRRPARVFASPAMRCVESANVLVPEYEIKTVEGLQEIDFGDFEGMRAQELEELPEYRAWIDSNGKLPFPNGESREDFVKRVSDAFKSTLATFEETDLSSLFVVHGGTIMAIMSAFSDHDYFEFQVAPATGCDALFEVCGDDLRLLAFSRLDVRVYA